jgi:hypothetical protein
VLAVGAAVVRVAVRASVDACNHRIAGRRRREVLRGKQLLPCELELELVLVLVLELELLRLSRRHRLECRREGRREGHRLGHR